MLATSGNRYTRDVGSTQSASPRGCRCQCGSPWERAHRNSPVRLLAASSPKRQMYLYHLTAVTKMLLQTVNVAVGHAAPYRPAVSGAKDFSRGMGSQVRTPWLLVTDFAKRSQQLLCFQSVDAAVLLASCPRDAETVPTSHRIEVKACVNAAGLNSASIRARLLARSRSHN